MTLITMEFENEMANFAKKNYAAMDYYSDPSKSITSGNIQRAERSKFYTKI